VIRFLVRRLATLLPSVFGISLVTFVLVNLAMSNPDAADSGVVSATGTLDRETAQELGRAYGLHLPLFINFSIEDARTRAKRDIRRLADPARKGQAVRSLAGSGGAALPYLAAALPGLEFWTRYWSIYGSDFTPVRSARLVRRLIRREDQLALVELRGLDTFCMPEIMDALDMDLQPEAQARLVDLAMELTSRDDPLDPSDSKVDREIVINRWMEWWNQRYDLYTTFEGWRTVTGAITETRYFRWLSRFATFDFGVSVRDGRSVRAKIAERLPVTLLLSFLALVAAYGIAIPLGVISAVRRGSAFDRVTTVILFVLYSLPAFWVAMLLLRYVGSSGHLDWFPSQGLSSPGSESWPLLRRIGDTAHHLVLPVLCLSFVSMAMLARYQRVGMLQVIEKDFMRTARAKGLSKTRVIMRHGLRNGIIPVITMMGLQLPYLVSGSVVVERIFGIPGMGLETFEAIRAGDHAWLMAVVTVTAVLTMLGIVLSDLIYAVVDPRIVPGRRLEKLS
jgi:peptide/nickel transport system permease protein